MEKLVKDLEKVCCHLNKSRETQIPATFWSLAQAYQALLNTAQYPQGEKKVSGTDNKTTGLMATPTPETGTVATPLWLRKNSPRGIKNCSRSFIKKKRFYSLPVWTCISAINSKSSFYQNRGYRKYTPQGTLWFYLQDQGKDVRKWDGKPTLTLEAQVHELQGKTIRN